jgi:adenine-specific DNA methylase
VKAVREQLKKRRGGAADARLLCVITTGLHQAGVYYRLPSERDLDIVQRASNELDRRIKDYEGPNSLIPDEPLPPQGTLGFRVQLYGMQQWGDLFTPRQQLVLSTLTCLVDRGSKELSRYTDIQFSLAVSAVLSMTMGKLADYLSSLCVWRIARSCVAHTFGRQALPITWDFGEMNPFAGSAGDWDEACRYLDLLINEISRASVPPGQAQLASAMNHPLPNGIASAFVTDPPYYDAVPYAGLSNYF